MSTLFSWRADELNDLLATCEIDDVTQIITLYLPKDGWILESGCGAGRFVKYLSDKGWNIVGLEHVPETIAMVHSKWPELNIIQGDASASPFPDKSFSGVISLGVVEHFSEGLHAPLLDIYRVLKPGGVAVITIPCLNGVRSIKKYLWLNEIFCFPRAFAKLLIKGVTFKINRVNKSYLYDVHPPYGDFYEYRLSPRQFINEINSVGFKVIKHIPIGHVDGIYHEMNPFGLVVQFEQWKFKLSWLGKVLDNWLQKIPFAHSHMQAVVVEKPR